MLGEPEPSGVGGDPRLASSAAGSAALKHAGAWLVERWWWLLRVFWFVVVGFFCLLFVCAHFVLF